MPFIDALTSEQQAQIPRYREKWRSLLLSTDRIDRPRAEEALSAAYLLAGVTKPEVHFFNGPQELRAFQEQQSSVEFLRQLGSLVALGGKQPRFDRQFTSEVKGQIWSELFDSGLLTQQYVQLFYLSTSSLSELTQKAFETSWQERQETLRQQPGGETLLQIGNSVQGFFNQLGNSIQPLTQQPFVESIVRDWRAWEQSGQVMGQLMNAMFKFPMLSTVSSQTSLCAFMDFCSSIVQFSDADLRYLATLRSVIRSCGFVAPFKNLCIVVERPIQILMDEDGRFHSESAAAVSFADASEFYAGHGDFRANQGLNDELWQALRWLSPDWR